MTDVRMISFVINGRIRGRSAQTWDALIKFLDTEKVDVVCAQGNGMDEGPYRLGCDEQTLPLKPELVEPIFKKLKEKEIPFVISLGGSAGADVHMNAHLDTIKDVCRQNGISFRVAVISGEIAKDYLKSKIRGGVKIRRSMDTPRLSEYLTEEEVEESVRIQAQMGPEPIMQALRQGVDGVITGRALDVGLCMAYPLLKGIDVATAAHAGKVMEVGANAAEPAVSGDFVFGHLTPGGFTVRPVNPALRCTVRSVASVSIHEREDPGELRMPGYVLDTTTATLAQVDDRTVLCRGATARTVPYTVKLEGVKLLGYQNLTLMAVRDPAAVASVDHLIEFSRKYVAELYPRDRGHEYEVTCHVFGRNGVLGPSEPLLGRATPHELLVMIVVIGKTQQVADRVGLAFGKSMFQAWDFPGRGYRSSAENVAWVTQPQTIPVGKTFAFNIWHLLPLEEPSEPFRSSVTTIP